MHYVLLISNDETAAIGAAERSGREAAFSRFLDELGTRDTLVYGGRLHGTETATTVRCWDGGDVNITDGPPAKSSEQLTGFMVVDCADLDEAIKVAAAVPAAWYGSVEMRPVR
jgi:hypothetical protein